MGFIDELEFFRKEEEAAQQHFFAYLALQRIPSDNPPVLSAMNRTPLFWLTVRHGMLVSAFVALGRVFDQNSAHNLDLLLASAARELHEFSPSRLEARKIAAGLDPTAAAAYVAGKTALSPGDIKQLRKYVANWRKVWEKRYRDIRHKVFAHAELAKIEQQDALFAGTNIEELVELLGFLAWLHDALWEAYHNGRAIATPSNSLVFPPASSPHGSPGSRVYHEAGAVLDRLSLANWPDDT